MLYANSESNREPERAKERLASHLKHATTLFCCKTVKYNSVLSQNIKIRYFLSRNIKIRYFLSRNVEIRDFLSRNVKIRAMSRKNGINCAVSWLRILCCSISNGYSNQRNHREIYVSDNFLIIRLYICVFSIVFLSWIYFHTCCKGGRLLLNGLPQCGLWCSCDILPFHRGYK